MPNHKHLKQAFTIIELLIVVVVIAILAAITIVAYNGITNQAKETTLKSDLRTAATDVELSRLNDTSYPENPVFKPSGDNSLNYSGGGASFCITATNPSLPGKVFSITQDGAIQNSACPNHPATVAGPMQSFTTAQCNALPVYTGSNESAVIGLTDSRGGTTRTYQVAKLADNKCWMLNNLKLGSTTSTITLTPSDSNIASNFTLPQVRTTGSTALSGTDNGSDTPYAYGPVPGDTGTGSTNYGYLYNWSAATAGATRESNPAGSGDAQNSICPANWRLPSGGATGTDFSQLDVAFGGSGAYQANSPSIPNWQNNGPFKGVFAGNWRGFFGSQGSNPDLWSRSTRATSDLTANNMNFAYPRYSGFGVRCLLN